ncbi:NAD(P)H-hydrate dehydratase [Leucobacter insecticola]|uniref:ADP-dependent (S)-NAD(P)H-hydrate dehydratase n=1 Tax=Leucobacter insecticola TaxID=2714934 RepID=A0A6G8FLY5_9MICO|nr:NAD(P)H-hydrate dehydratase [Leucobacter insecticola]
MVAIRTGSSRYPGAAVLSVSAAWRAGAGMVRYVPPNEDQAPLFGLPAPAAAVLAAHPETVFGDADKRGCDAWVIGSGSDPAERSAAERSRLLEILGGEAPVVIDAGALELAGAQVKGVRAPAILTPHLGEFARLWRGCGLGAPPGQDHATQSGRSHAARPSADHTDAKGQAEAAAHLAARLGATVLLKGSTTVVATPNGRCILSGPATPWLATAGTGDVLAGILGSLLAAHSFEVRADQERLAELGATAAVLHDTAARIAAGDPDATGAGHPITAADVAAAIPQAWMRVTQS